MLKDSSVKNLLNNREIGNQIEAIAAEKGITTAEVVHAMEDSMSKLAREIYGLHLDIVVKVDLKAGTMEARRRRLVVDGVAEDSYKQLTLSEALSLNPNLKVGDYFEEELPLNLREFGRQNAQNARQVLVQDIRAAERQRIYEEFHGRVGDIISCEVKRVDYGNVITDVNRRAEGIIRREELIQRETFKQGDRVRAYVYDVRPDARGPMILLSRTHPQFLAKLFAQEVPEIYEGVIEVKAVARDPGSRAKIGVISRDPSIDPVGACVGMRGSRVQAVVSELQGEKIDIIPWSPDPAAFVVNALAPATVSRVVLDEDAHRIDVVVPDDQLSLAIGRRGQNVRLASQLTGWDIDILTEAEEAERRATEFKARTQLFTEAMDVDDVIAGLLVTEGFHSIEEIVDAPISELGQIQGFDEGVATELQNRAKNFLEQKRVVQQQKIAAFGIASDVLALPGMTNDIAVALGEKGIKTLNDVADLATDEMLEMIPAPQPDAATVEKIIMAAREHWFKNEG